MPILLINCVLLLLAIILSVPVYDFAIANEDLAEVQTEQYYYLCCGKSIYQGYIYSFCKSGNNEKCPFCNADQGTKTHEECAEEATNRVTANDADAMY